MALRFGVIQAPPAVNPCAFNRTCTSRGYAFDAALIACKSLHLNCTFSWYTKLDYGDYDESTRNATGLVGAIHNGDFDTSVPILTPTYSRFQAVSFSNAYFYSDVILATRTPTEIIQSVNWNLLYAFQWPIWTTIAIIFFISCLVLIAIVGSHQNHTYGHDPKWITFLKLSLFLITRQYNQVSKHPNQVGFVIAYWALAFVVLTSAYTSALFSQKLMGNMKMPFKDLDSFVDCVSRDQCKIIVSTISFSALQTLMLRGTVLGDRMNEAIGRNPIILADKTEIPGRILKEKSRYLVWIVGRNTFNYYTNNNENCQFYTVDTPYNDVCAFAVRKNSSLRMLKLLNKMGDVFRESGLQQSIESKYFNANDGKICGGNSIFQDKIFVQFSDVIMNLGFYALGMGASVVLLGAEVMIHWVFRHRSFR